MSTWNHRVLAFEHQNKSESEGVTFQICEVYYDKKGNPDGYTDQNNVIAYSLEKFNWLFEKYKESLSKPVLYGGEKFPQEYKL